MCVCCFNLLCPCPQVCLVPKKFEVRSSKFRWNILFFKNSETRFNLMRLRWAKFPDMKSKIQYFLRMFSLQSYLQINFKRINHFGHVQNLYRLKKLAKISRISQQKSRLFGYFWMHDFIGLIVLDLVRPHIFATKNCQIGLVRDLPVEPYFFFKNLTGSVSKEESNIWIILQSQKTGCNGFEDVFDDWDCERKDSGEGRWYEVAYNICLILEHWVCKFSFWSKLRFLIWIWGSTEWIKMKIATKKKVF